jgi:hypothetical protein
MRDQNRSRRIGFAQPIDFKMQRTISASASGDGQAAPLAKRQIAGKTVAQSAPAAAFDKAQAA